MYVHVYVHMYVHMHVCVSVTHIRTLTLSLSRTHTHTFTRHPTEGIRPRLVHDHAALVRGCGCLRGLELLCAIQLVALL